MIAYDKRGSVLVMREGAEVLVHDGPSEGPLWRKTLDATIVGLGADGERIVAVTAAGTVVWYGARTGDVQRTAKLDGAPTAVRVDMAKQRVVAVVGDKLVALAGDDAPTTLADHGAHAIAIRGDGAVLAATATELVTIAADGTRTAQASPAALADAPIVALAWHPEGFWALGTAGKLFRWDGSGDATHITNLPKGAALDFIACSARAIAIAWDHHKVVTMEWPSKETLASVDYPDRKVEGIDFGPWPWIGIALDLGDGNKQNLEKAQGLHRTDTHPGRDHHSWLVAVGGSSKDDKAEKAAGAAPAKKAAPAADRTAPAAPTTTPVGVIVAIAIIIALAIFWLVR